MLCPSDCPWLGKFRNREFPGIPRVSPGSRNVQAGAAASSPPSTPQPSTLSDLSQRQAQALALPRSSSERNAKARYNGCGKMFLRSMACTAGREPARCGGHGRHCIRLQAPLRTRVHTRNYTGPRRRGLKRETYRESISIQFNFTTERTSRIPAVACASCHSGAGSRVLARAPCIATAFEEDAGTDRPSQ